MQCPACGYVRKDTDSAPDWKCPSCEMAYNKMHVKERPHHSVSFLDKHLKILLIIVNALLLVLVYVYQGSLLKSTPKSTQIKPAYSEKAKPIEESKKMLDLASIDLNKIESTLQAAEVFASGCNVHAQVYRKANEDCRKSLTLYKEIVPELDKLRATLNAQKDRNMSYDMEWRLRKIKTSLDNIEKDISAANLIISH